MEKVFERQLASNAKTLGDAGLRLQFTDKKIISLNEQVRLWLCAMAGSACHILCCERGEADYVVYIDRPLVTTP